VCVCVLNCRMVVSLIRIFENEIAVQVSNFSFVSKFTEFGRSEN